MAVNAPKSSVIVLVAFVLPPQSPFVVDRPKKLQA